VEGKRWDIWWAIVWCVVKDVRLLLCNDNSESLVGEGGISTGKTTSSQN